MEEINDFLRVYEKKYKQIRNTFLLGYGIALSLYSGLTLWKGGNLQRAMFLIVFCAMFVNYVYHKHNQNANKIVCKYKQDMDTNFAITSCEKLLENKRRMDAHVIWLIYLSLLLDTCQFEKFELVYKENKKWMKAIRMNIALKKIYYKWISLQKDTTEYKKFLWKNCFWKNQRLRDKSKEVNYYYESKRYEKAIETIDQMDMEFPWDQKEFYAHKQRCLYHLNEKCAYPQVENNELLFVKRWRYLLEKGEEYFDEQADEMVNVIRKDMKQVKRKRNALKFIAVLAVLIMMFPSVFDLLLFLFVNRFL